MAVALNSFPTLLGFDFGGLGHLWSQNDFITSWLRLTANSNCLLCPHYTNTKSLSSLICCPWAYGSILNSYTHTTLVRFWCSGSLVSLHHGCSLQPPQTASCIHIRHIQSVWAHSYAVYGYKVAASNSYTHTTWVIFGVLLGHLWSQNDVITSWLRLTANSNCLLCPHYIYTKCLSTLLFCLWAYGSSLK
jgi:hypothetical protein